MYHNVSQQIILLQNVPTRIMIGGAWLRSRPNPGVYARNHYGANYLKHAESYVFTETNNPHEWKADGWRRCRRPLNHACLDKYPVDGNLLFNIDNFPEWKTS